MNADLKARLMEVARQAWKALGPGVGDIERTAAQKALEGVFHDIDLDADFCTHTAPEFDGPTYDPAVDMNRLTNQLGRVYALMADAGWRTLEEIHEATGDPVASISAQLRHLRKPRFGSYLVEKRHRGLPSLGLFEYRMLPPSGRIQRVVADIPDLKPLSEELEEEEIL